IAAFFGCLYAGVIAVPVSPPRSVADRSRLAGIVENAGPRVILSTRRVLPRLAPLLLGAQGGADVPVVAVEEAAPARDFRPPAITGDSLAFLQSTSGSTGRPRGVMVSHDNLLHNEEMIRAAVEHDEDRTVFAGWLPLYHDMGLIGNVLQSVYLGVPC